MSKIPVENCPCKGCICVAVCRNKLYVNMVSDCRLVSDYLYDTDAFSYAHRRDLHNERLQRMHASLNPEEWGIDPHIMNIIKKQGDELMAPIDPKREEINMFLSALRDSSNTPIFPQIRKALKVMGLKREEILYYERTGKPLENMRDFIDSELKDLDSMEAEISREFNLDRSFKQKSRKSLTKMSFPMACGITLLLVGGMISLLLWATGTENSTTEAPPAITETTPFKDGDKL